MDINVPPRKHFRTWLLYSRGAQPEHSTSFINAHHGIVQSSPLVVVHRVNRLSKLLTRDDDELHTIRFRWRRSQPSRTSRRDLLHLVHPTEFRSSHSCEGSSRTESSLTSAQKKRLCSQTCVYENCSRRKHGSRVLLNVALPLRCWHHSYSLATGGVSSRRSAGLQFPDRYMKIVVQKGNVGDVAYRILIAHGHLVPE